jgi:hypothetical protein
MTPIASRVRRVVAVMRDVELFTAMAFNVQPPVDVTMS